MVTETLLKYDLLPFSFIDHRLFFRYLFGSWNSSGQDPLCHSGHWSIRSSCLHYLCKFHGSLWLQIGLGSFSWWSII